MTVKQIYEQLLKAKRPIDFFGKISGEDELKKHINNMLKKFIQI